MKLEIFNSCLVRNLLELKKKVSWIIREKNSCVGYGEEEGEKEERKKKIWVPLVSFKKDKTHKDYWGLGLSFVIATVQNKEYFLLQTYCLF